jgi:hypothetical protein
MIITNDGGGYTYEYLATLNILKARDETVIIDGFCASGCTFYTAANHVCATQRASLFFHSSYFVVHGKRKYDPIGTRVQMQTFPPKIVEAVKARGGLTPKGFFIRGREVQDLIGACQQ